MYVKVSIPKAGDGAGCPVAKNPNVILIDVDDVLTEPTRSHGNVNMTGDYALKDGAKAIAVYLTPSTISGGYDTEGEDDARGFKHKFEGEHPGNDVALDNFIEHGANRGFILLSTNCDGSAAGVMKAYGSVCNPLFLTPECTDSKEANKTKLSLAQSMPQKFLPGIYSGKLPELAPAGDGEEKEGA